MLKPKELKEAYRLMLLSRSLDKKMLVLIRQGKSFFHIGCMGHEAIQVAASMTLTKGRDWLFPYYRDQAFCLGMGMSAQASLESFLAKASDPNSGGRQMPQHFGSKECLIPSSSSSTGTQYLQAVGAALAEQYNAQEKVPKEGYRVTVVCSGEGTTSQGDFHEALLWASKAKAPVIFLVENNGYAISVPILEQRSSSSVAHQAKGYVNLEAIEVDGCNFEASYVAFQKAVNRARKGEGPTLVEAKTVRLLPHSSSDDDKKYRHQQELKTDQERDPITLMRAYLLKKKAATAKELDALQRTIEQEVDELADKVLSEPAPDSATALLHVYSDTAEPAEKTPQFSANSKETVMVDAINQALSEELERDDKMLVFGQDVAGGKGGVFTATRGLTAKFGKQRCFNAPLAESSIVGVAIGMALKGLKPVVEIQFGDYIWTAMMQIRNELTTMRYRSNNMFSSPVVIRTPVGGYIHGGLCHSQNIEATFAHFPGIKIALASTALDAYGLLKSAIRGNDPVLFLEHKALYRQAFAKSMLPSDDWVLPFGKGAIRRAGADITVVTYGILVQRALEAASLLAEDNIDVEVIDLRTLVPYDQTLIQSSVAKTGRVLVLHEDVRFMGYGAEIAAFIAETCFTHLDAPVMRYAGADTPVPYQADLEEMVLPQLTGIVKTLRQLASF